MWKWGTERESKLRTRRKEKRPSDHYEEKKCVLFMHKLHSLSKQGEKKLAWGGYRCFSFLVLQNIYTYKKPYLTEFFLLSFQTNYALNWTRAPYYFIHFVYYCCHGRFINLNRKWFPVHFSLWFSLSLFLCIYVLCIYVVLKWCVVFFDHPFIIFEIQ